jgi:hypothetical protein
VCECARIFYCSLHIQFDGAHRCKEAAIGSCSVSALGSANPLTAPTSWPKSTIWQSTPFTETSDQFRCAQQNVDRGKLAFDDVGDDGGATWRAKKPIILLLSSVFLSADIVISSTAVWKSCDTSVPVFDYNQPPAPCLSRRPPILLLLLLLSSLADIGLPSDGRQPNDDRRPPPEWICSDFHRTRRSQRIASPDAATAGASF